MRRGGQPENDDARARRILAERARVLAAPPPSPAEDVLASVAFEAGAERYAIGMEHVLRVERIRAFARVPGASPEVVGVILVDGRPCALVDVTALLAGGRAGEPRRWAVVLGRKGPELAVSADAVDVAVLARARLAPARPPRLGTTPDARVVLDGAALLDASGARRGRGDAA